MRVRYDGAGGIREAAARGRMVDGAGRTPEMRAILAGDGSRRRAQGLWLVALLQWERRGEEGSGVGEGEESGKDRGGGVAGRRNTRGVGKGSNWTSFFLFFSFGAS